MLDTEPKFAIWANIGFYKEIDLRDLQSLKFALEEFRPTHIIHLAATTGMDDFELKYFDANTVGVKNLVSVSNQLKDLNDISSRIYPNF